MTDQATIEQTRSLLVRAAAIGWGVSEEALMSRDRRQPLALQRSLLILALHEEYSHTQEAACKAFNREKQLYRAMQRRTVEKLETEPWARHQQIRLQHARREVEARAFNGQGTHSNFFA